MKTNATSSMLTAGHPLLALGLPGSKVRYGIYAQGSAFEVWLEPRRAFVNAFPSLAGSRDAVTRYFRAREAALAIAYRP